jgi:hypothetical protein
MHGILGLVAILNKTLQTMVGHENFKLQITKSTSLKCKNVFSGFIHFLVRHSVVYQFFVFQQFNFFDGLSARVRVKVSKQNEISIQNNSNNCQQPYHACQTPVQCESDKQKSKILFKENK